MLVTWDCPVCVNSSSCILVNVCKKFYTHAYTYKYTHTPIGSFHKKKVVATARHGPRTPREKKAWFSLTTSVTAIVHRTVKHRDPKSPRIPGSNPSSRFSSRVISCKLPWPRLPLGDQQYGPPGDAVRTKVVSPRHTAPRSRRTRCGAAYVSAAPRCIGALLSPLETSSSLPYILFLGLSTFSWGNSRVQERVSILLRRRILFPPISLFGQKLLTPLICLQPTLAMCPKDNQLFV